MIILPPDAPYASRNPTAPLPPLPGPSNGPHISPEDDLRRLFNVCKVGHGNAELLQEVLVFAQPDDLRGDITKEFLSRCRASQELISSQIPWATAQTERSRRDAYSSAPTIEEELLAALLAANEELTECLKMYEDLVRIGSEAEADERLRTERLVRLKSIIKSSQFTPDESTLADRIMAVGDPTNRRFIPVQTATRILAGANLPPSTLGRIWELASGDSKDGIDRQGIGVAIRLIGHAQRGTPVNEGIVNRPGPLAVIADLAQMSPSMVEPSRPPSANGLPPLTSHDKAKFKTIFKGSGPQGGILMGPQVKEVFMKSRLPWQTLSKVWNLSDVRHRGFLDLGDFTVAMYLIQGLMSGKIAALPASLPQSLYDEASRVNSSRQNSSPTPPALPPRNGVESSPFNACIPPLHSSSSRASRVVAARRKWEVTPALKVQATHTFQTLDPESTGVVMWEAARRHLHQIGLNSQSVSKIWDLVDRGSKGYLTLEEFSVAMLLVKMKRDDNHLPEALPPWVLPGSGVSPEEDAYDGIASDTAPPAHSRRAGSQSESGGQAAGTPGTLGLPPLSSTFHLSVSAPSSPHPQPPPSPFLTTAPPRTPRNDSAFSSRQSRPTTEYASPTAWHIKPQDRARYDRHFDKLDTMRRGNIEADVAVAFFARAKLANDVMATIWDMADADHDGRLSREDFAVAMFLIKQKLAGRELPVTVPASLMVHSDVSHTRSRSQPPSPRVPQPAAEQASSVASPVAGTPGSPSHDELRSDTPPPPYELISRDSFRSV